MGASPSNGTPLFRFSGRFIPISRPTPINAGGGLRRPQRQQRPCERCVLCGPQYLITGAMTLSEMAVLAIDEILLRTEISGRVEEGARRRASERVRRGCGRDKRGPPARRRATSLRNGPGAGAAATSAALPHDAARLHFGTGRGAGTAATSAALPHDAARLHFGTGPARVRPRQARPSRMTPRDFASERARRGYGRDKRGPPVRRRANSLRNGPGVGTAATSAALPHDAARLHFGTGPARVRPRQARPSRMTPRDFTSERARRGCGRDKRGPPA